MNLRDWVVQVAQNEVGVKEEGGENRGPRVQVYQSSTWLTGTGWPWCAAFCSWVLREALIRYGVSPAAADRWRCRDASAFGWIAWGQKTPGCLVLGPQAQEQLGDFVVFDFNGPTAAGGGHIGIVERAVAGDPFQSIEGNTNAAGEREGGAVLRKTRGTRSVVNFIRLPEHPT